MDCKGEAGVLSGDAGFEGIFEGEEVGEEGDNTISGKVQTRRRKGLEVFLRIGENIEAIVIWRKD